MKFLRNSGYALLMFLLVISCSDDVTNVNADANGRVVGSIHGVVTDANTNARLDNVKVTWVSNGKISTKNTDAEGYFVITGLTAGDYELTFTLENFAVGRSDVHIPTVKELGTMEEPSTDDYHLSLKNDMDMYPLTSSISGRIFARQDNENTIPVSGVVVVADYSAFDISPNEYTTLTDANGNYTFSSLPSTTTLTMRTLPFSSSGYDYQATVWNQPITPGWSNDAGDKVVQIAPQAPLLIQNNFLEGKFALTDSLTMTFSKTMNPSTMTIDLWSNIIGDVDFDVSWSNGITLTITPHYPLAANNTYNLSLSGKSTDNNDFTFNGSFQTIDGIKVVSTNLERSHGLFDEFPVDSDIRITFDMEVDLNISGTYMRILDPGNNIVPGSITLPDLNTVAFQPTNDLNNATNYRVEFQIYSNIPGDHADASDIATPLTFRTVE